MFIKLEREITNSQIQSLFDTIIEDIEDQLGINIEDLDKSSLLDIFDVLTDKADELVALR